mmetsp:Transcript_3773/g.3216  ORF Transcript_3773/g.3216 Transcript_3773/m.3216 type:complete len:101 (+) Transcript_3773:524-826(+)
MGGGSGSESYTEMIASAATVGDLEMAINKILGDLEEAKLENTGESDETAILGRLKMNKDFLETCSQALPKFSGDDSLEGIEKITKGFEIVLYDLFVKDEI